MMQSTNIVLWWIKNTNLVVTQDQDVQVWGQIWPMSGRKKTLQDLGTKFPATRLAAD